MMDEPVVFLSEDSSTKRTAIFWNNEYKVIHQPSDARINEAQRIVNLAIDHQFPHAYKCVKPMYYLVLRAEYTNREGIVVRNYEQRVSVDESAKLTMVNNYYKLRTALKFLAEEGYVASYSLFNNKLELKVTWYDDLGASFETVTDYSRQVTVPTEVEPFRRLIGYKQRKKRSDPPEFWIPMSLHKGLQGKKQGMLESANFVFYPKAFDGAYYGDDMILRQSFNEGEQARQRGLYEQARLARIVFIHLMARWYPKPIEYVEPDEEHAPAKFGIASNL
jgi:hypothetical protein